MLVKQTLLWGFMLSLFAVSGVAGAQKEEEKKGTVIGEVTAKGDGPLWVEVKADGEETARRYVPNWVGGVPAQGGGPDKTMVKQIESTALGARVKLDWKFEERPRVVKIEVLKAEKK